MRVVLLVALLAACKDSWPNVDAGPGSGSPFPCPCAQAPEGVEPCTLTCGNDQIDQCYVRSPMGCKCVTVITEACDGPVDCVDLGYYAGTATCACTNANASSCDACAPTTLACTNVALSPPKQLAPSGTHVALAADGAIAIFDGLQPVTTVSIANIRDLVATPTGWLVATSSPPALSTLDRAGVRGSPLASPAAEPAMAAGPGDRVLLAWKQLVGSAWRTHVAIADVTGTIVVPADDLFAAGDWPPSVTSDGTSFFVGALGQLARVAPDGTRTIVTGFPVQPAVAYDIVRVTWSGTTGWYVSWSKATSTFIAQRFDANGAMVGPRVPVNLGTPPSAFLADGDDLLALRFQAATMPTHPRRLELVRVDATGTSTAITEVGVGSSLDAVLARVGDNVIVGWSKLVTVQQLALVAP